MESGLRTLSSLRDQKKTTVVSSEYVLARDHCQIYVHFGCTHRSGVCRNMLVSEYEKAKHDESDDTYIIQVFNHKTFGQYGPAIVVLLPHQYLNLKAFVDIARPSVPKIPGFNNVFPSREGNHMAPGDVSKRLHYRFVQAGVIDPNTAVKNLTLNIVQKSTSTGISTHQKESLGDVAGVMGHSTKTQSSHYIVPERKQAKSGSRAIHKFYGIASQRKLAQTCTKKQQNTKKPRSVPFQALHRKQLVRRKPQLR